VDLKHKHPNLYRGLMAYALLSIGLGLNFLILNPTFKPFGIPKVVCGVVFLALGLAHFSSLTIFKKVKLQQFSMAAIISVMFFWAGINTAEFFRLGQTSLQLPLVFFGLVALGLPLLIEPPINPITAETEDVMVIGGNKWNS
jgi:hypothetical protein